MKLNWYTICTALVLVLGLCTPAAALDGSISATSTLEQPAEGYEAETLPDFRQMESEFDETRENEPGSQPDSIQGETESDEALAEEPDSNQIETIFSDEEVLLPDEDPTEFGIFQNGDSYGPQTIPGEAELMSDTQTELYNRILEGVLAKAEKIDIRGVDGGSNLTNIGENKGLLAHTFSQVVNDHPELFYVYWFSSSGKKHTDYFEYKTLRPKYYELPDMAQAQRDFDAAIDRAKAAVEPGMTPLETALALHDYIILNAGYNWETANDIEYENHMVATAYGALVDGNTICEGYTLAYALLLREFGLESLSVYVPGHIWNMVRLDKSTQNWYHIDLTWDDPAPNREGYVKYQYFMVDDDGFPSTDTTHVKENWYHGLPVCTDTTYRNSWINKLRSPLHRYHGQYYYTPTNGQLYRTGTLSQEGSIVFDKLSTWFSLYYGQLLVGDSLYYVPYLAESSNNPPGTDITERTLMLCDLRTGTLTQVGQFHFTKTAVGEKYDADYDVIGLRYNAASNTVEVSSSTRRQVLASFPVQTYPAEWGSLPVESQGVGIAGLTADGKAAGILNGSSSARREGLTLWAAYYRNGRMVAVKSVPIDPTAYRTAPHLKLVPLPETGRVPAYDSVRLMVLQEGFLPACTAWSSAA